MPPQGDEPVMASSTSLSSLNIKKDGDAADLSREMFPGSLPGSEVLKIVAKVIEARGFNDDNTLFAQSVCPDEINHEEGDITCEFTKYLGEVFHMGGLAGIPFTGKTGFAAFSHHVPDDGHCFVLQAPHVGISESLKLGKYTRDGQCGAEGAACGAAVGALGACCSGGPLPSLLESTDDYQMTYIMHEINKYKEELSQEPDENRRQAALGHATWAIGKKMLDTCISTDFGSDTSTLVVLSGIQINMPRPYEDFFQPLTFEWHKKDGTVENLFDEAFGDGIWS